MTTLLIYPDGTTDVLPYIVCIGDVFGTWEVYDLTTDDLGRTHALLRSLKVAIAA